jgi:uncharacterized protein (TIGR02231 family)
MKKHYLLFLLLPFFGQSQEINYQDLKTNIDKVKLYLTAGQMTHEQDVKLTKGRNKLIFSGISAYADPQSIQFKGENDYKLVSVSTEMDFLAAEEFNPRISVFKDSLESLNDEQQSVSDNLDAYFAEQAVLNTNRDLGGKSESLTVAQIREAADFYRERTLKVNQAITKLKKRRRKLKVQIEDTRFQLVELNYNENQRSNQVIVLLDCETNMTMGSTLKYLVSDCGWAATYDLSALDLNQQINLKYKAQVYNNTGNAWKDVVLTLSTADPNLSASHPELSPWYLSHYAPQLTTNGLVFSANREKKDFRQEAVQNINKANERAYDNYYIGGEELESEIQIEDNVYKLRLGQNVGNQNVQMKNIEISELTTEFEIKNRFSCPSDAKPYMVDVKDMNLDATFSYITVPKLDRAAFLLAHIADWQDLDLIPGPTHVYFGGQYVGMSRIDTRNVSDTLSLSFGRDDKVTVMRKLKKEMSTKRVMGNTKKEAYLYEIAVRNNRSVPIKIEVYDQVPISQSNDISVFVDEISEGTKDELTGEVVWNLTISSGGVQSKEIGYTVKYPKNANVTMKRFRTISAPSF